MRQYANQNGSGTMMNSQRAPEPLDNVIDRVMAIAQRVVGAENVIKNQSNQIKQLANDFRELKTQNAELKKKIENIALKASGKEFKKPTTTRSKKAAVVEEPVVDSILEEGEEVK